MFALQLEKLLKRARSVLIGVPKEGKEEGGISLDIHKKQGDLLSKCALFVCNKWDVVQEQEVQSVKNDVVKKLKRAWSGIDPESQIIYMSTKRATTAQNLGVISKDFSSLMEGMRSVILQSIEAKLELHWNWLYTLLSRIVVQAKMFVVNASRSNEEINQKMKEVNHRLEVIGKDQRKVIKDLHGSFNEKVNGVVQQLCEYLSSEEVIEEFTSRSSDKLQDLDEEMSWKEVEEEITTVLSSLFQEIVERWEDENRVFANARLFLMQKFQDCYDGVESELQNLQSDATGVHGGAGISEKKTFRFHFSIPRKALMQMMIFTVGALFYIAEAIDDVFDSELLDFLENLFEPDVEKFWTKTSTNFLATRRKNKELRKFVQDKLRDAKLYLDHIEECLPALIEADRELYKQLSRKLLEETRSKEKTKDRYEPILVKGSQLRDQLALFGITDVCVVKIDREELDWKEEMSSHLGSGAFAAVYKGTMTRREEVTTVALKVCKEALNADNASEIMQEMKILRVLNHPHIVQFYGISLVKSTSRMIFVMEKCKGNLKNYIFRELKSAAGRSENPTIVGDLCRYAKEITDGLAFIHAMEVVHRDLKLENILLSEENTVKIADVGLAKAEVDITGTLAGTPVYMAPEVRHSRVYHSKADIYSLGLIMWEMWYAQQAFADAPGKTFQDFFKWVDEGNRPVDRQGCKTPPSFWEQLMKQCWDGNPDERPTAKECNERIVSSVRSETYLI
ncbi:unnamed protein product [Porites lobata]|uniref:Protein kinase domain-containing protein n=1 Tax=Porites lobata TaxID=104759 RepID=A0ABN8P4U6_9CNID|nr:unnamed protein product [Porites lobata]